MSRLIDFCKSKLDAWLREPFVSKDYSVAQKENLFAGLKIAFRNGKTGPQKVTREQILSIFNAMNPAERQNLKYTFRRGSVCIGIFDANYSQDGLEEILNWADKHHAGYGPRMEVIDAQNRMLHFRTIEEIRNHYQCNNNHDLAIRLNTLLSRGHRLTFVPIFDSLNPFFHCKVLSSEEQIAQEQFAQRLRSYETFDVIEPKFDELLNAFNQKTNPSLRDISSFIKDMILLHPFPNGNGRTFMLGLLNQLLLQYGYGICLEMNPHVAGLSVDEIVQKIKQHLISMDTLAPYLDKPNTNEEERGLLTWCNSLNVLDIFSTVLGTAAVAIGLVLAASNFIIPGFICTGLGLGLALQGLGLFATVKSCNAPDEVTMLPTP